MATSIEEYIALQEAVDHVYGTDTWLSVVGTDTYNSVGFAELMEGIEGVSVNYAKDGSILGYNYNIPTNTAVYNPGSIVNSNVTSTALKTNVSVPANTVVDGTGKVVAESGLKTVSSGSTVTATLGKVAVGVGAVAAGIKLGAAIDGALYNANPDFWDSNGMSAINPQTWDSICSTQGGRDVFNMVFGIDKDTGETQAYMQQEAFAQIAQYLEAQGAFNFSNEIDADPSVYSAYTQETIDYLNNTLPWKTTVFNGINYVKMSYSGDWFKSMLVTDPNVSCFVFADDNGRNSRCIMMSKTAFTYKRSLNRELPNWDNISPISADQYTTKSGKTFYFANDGTWYPIIENHGWNLIIPTCPHSTDMYQAMGELLYGGTISSGSIDGITQQDGATTPTGINESMTTAEVISQLQTLYPNLFDRAITNEVVQPDGSTKTFTYVPVGFPDDVTKPTPTSELQPTGGTGTSQASDTITENSSDSLLQTFLDIFTTPDPYEPTENPDPNDYPDTGDGVTPTPVIPSGSASALYSIYNPSQAELNNFGAWLWSNDFVDQLKKIFNDPMQAIIGLHKVFATPATNGSGTIKVGYLNSGVSANLVSNQYTTIDCGTVNLYEYFGNVLDYTQTEVYLYLPFVGIVRVNVDDVMRSAINIIYKVDVLTGACLCSVNVTRDLSGGQLYTYSGNCAVQYPLSSGSYMGIVSSALGIAGSVVGTIASGGALLPMALGVGAGALASAKTQVEHSGSLTGNAGAMGIKTPYIIIKRPQTKIAEGFKNFNGIAENKTVKINTLSGFVKAKHTKLSNIAGATQSDYAEIERLLKEGFYV